MSGGDNVQKYREVDILSAIERLEEIQATVNSLKQLLQSRAIDEDDAAETIQGKIASEPSAVDGSVMLKSRRRRPTPRLDIPLDAGVNTIMGAYMGTSGELDDEDESDFDNHNDNDNDDDDDDDGDDADEFVMHSQQSGNRTWGVMDNTTPSMDF